MADHPSELIDVPFDELETVGAREPVVGPFDKCQAEIVAGGMGQKAQGNRLIDIKIGRPL